MTNLVVYGMTTASTERKTWLKNIHTNINCSTSSHRIASSVMTFTTTFFPSCLFSHVFLWSCLCARALKFFSSWIHYISCGIFMYVQTYNFSYCIYHSFHKLLNFNISTRSIITHSQWNFQFIKEIPMSISIYIFYV